MHNWLLTLRECPSDLFSWISSISVLLQLVPDLSHSLWAPNIVVERRTGLIAGACSANSIGKEIWQRNHRCCSREVPGGLGDAWCGADCAHVAPFSADLHALSLDNLAVPGVSGLHRTGKLWRSLTTSCGRSLDTNWGAGAPDPFIRDGVKWASPLASNARTRPWPCLGWNYGNREWLDGIGISLNGPSQGEGCEAPSPSSAAPFC